MMIGWASTRCSHVKMGLEGGTMEIQGEHVYRVSMDGNVNTVSVYTTRTQKSLLVIDFPNSPEHVSW